MYRFISEPFYFWQRTSAKVLMVIFLGILSASFFPLPLYLLLAGIFLPLLFSIFYWKKEGFRSLWLSLTCFCFVYFSIQIRVFFSEPQTQTVHYSNLAPLPFAKARIITLPKEKENFWTYQAEIQALLDTENVQEATGKMMLHLSKNAADFPPDIGDFIYFPFAPQALLPPSVLDTFDYATYLKNQGIIAQQWVSNFNLQPEKYPPPLFFLQRLQQKWVNILQTYVPDPDSFSILSALILGEKRFLDEKIQTAFADTGAIHVLAVSGLHVGIVKCALDFLLFGLLALFLSRRKNAKSIYKKQKLRIEWCTLFLVWGYALLTGASDSVLRSVCMLSMWTLFRTLRVPISSWDAVFSSAILLLMYDPAFLFHVGFQFSYAAVFGILALYKPLSAWYNPKKSNFRSKKIPLGGQCKKYLWNLTCVGLGAQIGVLPLSLLYFKKVAILFWLVNPVVLTLASFLLPAGLALLFLHLISLPFLAAWLGLFLSKTTAFMLGFVQKIELFSFLNLRLDFSSFGVVFLIYLLFYLLFVGWQQKSFVIKYSAALVLLLLASVQIFQQYFQKPRFILTHYKGNFAFIYSDPWEKWVLLLKAFEKSEDSLTLLKKVGQFAGSGQPIAVQVLGDISFLKTSFFQYQKGYLQFLDRSLYIVPENFSQFGFQENNLDFLVYPYKNPNSLATLETFFKGARKFIASTKTLENWENVYSQTVILY